MLSVRLAALAFLVCLWAFFAAGIPQVPAASQAYPLILLAALLLAVPLHVLRLLRRDPDRSLVPVLPGTPGARIRLVLFAAIWLAYVVALPKAGFVVATTVATAGSIVTLGPRRPVLAVLASLLVSLCLFALMERVLFVPVPRGSIEDSLSVFLYQMTRGS